MNTARPFLKWAGGKTQVLKHIHRLIENIDTKNTSYYEPFLGAGSMFFSKNFKRAVINDLNEELINTYIQLSENLPEVFEHLKEHKSAHMKDPKTHYYFVREWDRKNDYLSRTKAERAARIIYLNKTCYNGLYRVNSKGEFNTPIGSYKNPNILDKENLVNVSSLLKKKKIIIKSQDFEEVVKYAKPGALIYFDPPYDYDHENGFVNYHKSGFGEEELKRLRDISKKLIERGCFVIISNHDTKRVRKYFSDDKFIMEKVGKKNIEFITEHISTNRSINSIGTARKSKVQEVLIYGSNLPTSR